MIKKVLRFIYIALPILFFIAYLNMYYYDDYQTLLLQGTYIQNKQTDLVANKWAVPLATDWNGDGNKDLLIGNRSGSKGYISFYQNTGTDNSPLFEGFTYVKTCTDICSNLTIVPEG